MDPERHQRITALFLKAGELPPAERQSFLARACGGDSKLLREVLELLERDGAGNRRATEQLEAPVRAAVRALTPPDDQPSVTRDDFREQADTRTLDEGEPAAPAEAPKEVAGYRILGQLGAGGMGTVFEAFEEQMGRKVALKVINKSLSLSQKAADRFARETWIAGKLNHPALVKVFATGTRDDVTYYSMELVDGGSFGDIIRKLKAGGRDADWGLEFGSREYIVWAITQVIAVARGLDYAHRQGVVHRDIKPMNLLLSRDLGTPKIVDFGLAFDLEATRVTRSGQAIGTPAYMSPEQIRGRRAAIDGRTDIYSLAVTLFELLTLQFPYRAPSQELYINAVLSSEALSPSKLNKQVSRDLDTVIRKALEKDPRDRYETAAEFADDLENVLQFRPIKARPPGPFDRFGKWVVRKPLQATLAGFLLVALPTVGILGWRGVTQARLLRQAEIVDLEVSVGRLAMSGDSVAMLVEAGRLFDLAPGNEIALRSLAVGNFNLALPAGGSEQDERLRASALRYVDQLIAAHSGTVGHYRLKADFLRRWGRDGEAAAIDRHADALRPSDDEDSLYYSALTALLSGELERAEAELSRLLVRRRRADALLWRGDVRARLERSEDASEDYRAAIDMNPRDPLPHYKLGRLFMNHGQFAEARAHLDRALALDPDGADLHELYADVCIRDGRQLRTAGDRAGAMARFREAGDYARRSLDIESGRPLSHVNLGISLVERNRTAETGDPALLREALEQFARARALVETPAGASARQAVTFAMANVCDVLIELKDIERAIATCGEVVALWPDEPTVHYNLAGAYMLAGRADDALAALERDLELGDIEHDYLRADPWFASLRDDARFRDLLARMERAATAAGARGE